MSNKTQEREVKQQLPESVSRSLEVVIDYLWNDERRDFVGQPNTEHVFRALVMVDGWLFGHRRRAEEYVGRGDYFGVCPVCRTSDGYLNVGRDHWFVCHEHGLRWCAGSNLFSSWKGQAEAEWQANWRRIEACREIEPVCGDRGGEVEEESGK